MVIRLLRKSKFIFLISISLPKKLFFSSKDQIFDIFDPKSAEPNKKRNIDVWWIHDDGGLIVLLAHLIRNHKPFKDARVRVITHGKENAISSERQKLLALLKKFRIDVTDIEVIDLNKKNSGLSNFEKKMDAFRLHDKYDASIENPRNSMDCENISFLFAKKFRLIL